MKNKIILGYTEVLSILLVYAYGMSLLADYGWFFDIHSHFTIQYVLAGVILGTVFLCFRRWGFALSLFLISIINIYEIRYSYSDPWIVTPPQHTREANLTIVQFNKLFGNQDWLQMEAWIAAHYQDIDVMFIQESGVRTLYKLQKFKGYFPHQFPPHHEQIFNDVSVLSRYPLHVEEIPSLNKNSRTAGTKVIFQRPDMPQPVHLYSIHTEAPTTQEDQRENREDLLIMQRALVADPHPYKIFSGDWNITPYSSAFQKLLRESGMKYNDYALWPKSTWHSAFYFPFLKIPIDHMIYSAEVMQISKEVGPDLGSDHHVLIGRFYIPQDSVTESE